LLQWSEQVVTKSEEWLLTIHPMIVSFWEDVAQAKEGNFVVPESTRAPKRKKEEECMIVFRKLDEEGEEQEQEQEQSKRFMPSSQNDDTVWNETDAIIEQKIVQIQV
jgi:peptide deformylase